MAGETLSDVDLFVFHQANARILIALTERLELTGACRRCDRRHRQHVGGIDPLALAQRAITDTETAGSRAARPFGAGLTCGATLVDGAIGEQTRRRCLVGIAIATADPTARGSARPIGAGARRRRLASARHLPREQQAEPRRPSKRSRPAVARTRSRPTSPTPSRSPIFDAAEAGAADGPVLALVNNAGIRDDDLASHSTTRLADRDRHEPHRRLPAHAARAAPDDPRPLRPRRERRLDRRPARQRRSGELRRREGRPDRLTKTAAHEVARRGVTVNASPRGSSRPT